MNPSELTNEQKAKLKSCKDQAELLSMLDDMSVELSDEQLEAMSGGDKWDHYSCNDLCLEVYP